MRMSNSALMSSDRMDWETPQWFFEKLNNEFGFTLDAAASDANHKCDRYYTSENSGLEADWSGNTVFCNPPYGRSISDWVRKCSNEASKPGTTVVLLIPARTDTRYFQNFILNRSEIRFVPGRLRFETGGVPGDAAPFPSMVVIMRSGIRDSREES